ncbi:MAG: universal stress protein [Synergistaceae bacterium]|jgi:nucleotide-binding universal stress UspA family protein|nr:universal stress protein [Synergistaceae bacterium]
MKKVVVAIDGSEESRGVIDYAVHYANREADAEMHFLHVIGTEERGRVFVEGFAVELPTVGEKVKKDFEEFVQAQIAKSGRTIPRMTVTVLAGVPYEQIVKFAEENDADIIMIGHRGLSNLKRFFLGSVAAKVVAHAPCSVYVHRPKGRQS